MEFLDTLYWLLQPYVYGFVMPPHIYQSRVSVERYKKLTEDSFLRSP